MEIPESGLRLVSHCTVGLRPSANDLATLPYFGDIGHNILCKCILCLCIMGNILCLCTLYNILVHLIQHSCASANGLATLFYFGDIGHNFLANVHQLYALSVGLIHGLFSTMKIVCTEICAVFCVYVLCARLAEQTVKKGLVVVPVPCTSHRQTNRFTI